MATRTFLELFQYFDNPYDLSCLLIIPVVF